MGKATLTTAAAAAAALAFWLVGCRGSAARSVPVRLPHLPYTHGHKLYFQSNADCLDASILTSFFTQRLDHFCPASSATFSQRYLHSWRHFNKAKPTVFLMVGGESEISNDWACGETVYAQMAREQGAVVVQLEHRFYGQSIRGVGCA